MSRNTRSYRIKGLAEQKPRDGLFFNVETLFVERLLGACRGYISRSKTTTTVKVERLVPDIDIL
jgi:hypothetical protein